MSGLTEQQLELRRTGIGASEIAALAGLSRWATPLSIWESKVLGQRDEVGLPAYLGTALEEPLARLYAEQHPGAVLVPSDTLRGPGIALCTPDRLAFGAGQQTPARVTSLEQVAGADLNVQIKSTSWRMAREWGEEGSDQVPEEYLAQVTWEMGVTGLPATDVFVLFDKDRVATFRATFSPELWLGLLEIAERFWRDHVVAKVPPPPDATERYREYLSRAWPTANGVVRAVDPGSDLELECARYAKLCLASSRLRVARKQADNVIRSVIGSTLGLAGSFGTVKWHRKPDTTTPDHKAQASEALTLAGLVLDVLATGQPVPADHLAQLRAQLVSMPSRLVKPKKGFNQLRAAWSPELRADLRTLELSLDALESGDTEDDDTDEK